MPNRPPWCSKASPSPTKYCTIGIGRQSPLPPARTTSKLPPYSPELNPVENIWEYLRQNYLSNRTFATYETIVDACCDAWNKLIAAPERIRSIATREYAKTVSS